MSGAPDDPLRGTVPFRDGGQGQAAAAGGVAIEAAAKRETAEASLMSMGRTLRPVPGGRRAAIVLAVGAVVGVKAIAAGDLQDLPPLLQDAPAAVVSAIGTLDGELLLMLRNCSVLPADDALERVGP